MKNPGLSKTQKRLLALSAGLILLAEIVRRIPMREEITVIAGAFEIVVAVLIGIGFGVATTNAKLKSGD